MDSSMQVKKTQAEVSAAPNAAAQSLTLAISVIKV